MNAACELTREIEEINGFDFSKSWKQYAGTLVAFDMQEGMICEGKDAADAKAKAKTWAYPHPWLYDVDCDETFLPE